MSILAWVSGYFVADAINNIKFSKHKYALRGRVVRLDEAYCTKQGIARYGVIAGVTREYKNKILEVEVGCVMNEDRIKKLHAYYDKQYELKMKEYARQLHAYNQNVKIYGQGAVQAMSQSQQYLTIGGAGGDYHVYQQPYKPTYDFSSNSGIVYRTVSKSLTKLMPKGFDITTQSIIKPIKEGKEVKRRRTMPRIFKYLFLLAGVIIALSVAITLNNMMPQLLHQWFIKN